MQYCSPRSSSRIHKLPQLLAVFSLLLLALRVSALDAIADEQMVMTEPKIDPEAVAEYFYYEEKSVDSMRESASSNRSVTFRMKIFKEVGVMQMTPFQLKYPSAMRLSRVRARVTKPNGEKIFLDQDTVETERSELDDDYSIKRCAMSFPNLAVGDILDVTFSLSSLSSIYYTKFELYRRYPSHHTKLMFQPFSLPGYGWPYQTFKSPGKDWIKEKGDSLT